MLCIPYVTRTKDCVAPLDKEGRLGRSAGLLCWVRYLEPSPLTYDELIWMPCRVRARGRRGHHVSVMYVDDPTTLRAGREVWALPKTSATFHHGEDGGCSTLDVTAPGTFVRLRMRLPSVRSPKQSGTMATLQTREGRVVRFKASFRTPMTPCLARVDAFESTDPAWAGFAGAGRWRPGVWMDGFDSTMHEPSMLT